MSLKAIRWAFQRPMNDATAKAVLVALAEHVEDGRDDCWPSAARLGKYTALAERTVRAILIRLDKMGAIRVEERDGKTPLCTLLFDWGGETLPRCRTPRSRSIKNRQTPVSDTDVTPASHADLPRRQTAATPVSHAQTPVSDTDEPYEPLMNLKRGDEDFSEVPEADHHEDDIGCDLPPEHDGAVLARPPSDDRSGGARTPGDVLDRFMRQTGPPVKRKKRQDKADADMVRWLTTEGGMGAQRAWELLMAARDEADDGHTAASRELERISRKHKLGWFAEEMA